MVATTEPPVLDLWRADRNAATIDDQLRERDIPAVQRALITLLIVHPHMTVEDGMRRLQISLRAAADWLRQHCSAVAGMACDHSSVRKALQVWIDRGVVTVTGDGNRIWWLDKGRLTDWFDGLAEDNEPIFKPVYREESAGMFPAVPAVDHCRPLLTSGDSCGPVGTAVDRCGPVGTRVDSHDDDDLSNSKHSSSTSSPPREEPARERIPPQSSRSLTDAIRSLPDLPAGIWSADTSDRKCVALLNAWWAERGLQEQHGPESDQIRLTLLGLICLARPKDNPLGYFQTCLRLGVRPAVASTGRNYQDRHRERAYVAHG